MLPTQLGTAIIADSALVLRFIRVAGKYPAITHNISRLSSSAGKQSIGMIATTWLRMLGKQWETSWETICDLGETFYNAR